MVWQSGVDVLVPILPAKYSYKPWTLYIKLTYEVERRQRILRIRRDMMVNMVEKDFLFASYIPDLDLRSQQPGNTNVQTEKAPIKACSFQPKIRKEAA